MFTKYKYSLKDVVLWTRYETMIFVLIALAATVLYEGLELRWIRLPWTPIALVGTAVAFLIGFQNNAAYGRAWEARKIWGGIVNASRSWAIQVRDLISNERTSEPISAEDLQAHHTKFIHRHLAWLTALRHAMRVRRPWEVFVECGTNKEWYEKIYIPERETSLDDDLKPLLDESEYTYVMSKTNKSAATAALQSRHLRAVKERGLLSEFAFLKLQTLLEELITLQGKSERIKNFPYPRQYATLGHELVRVFVLLLPFGVIPEFADIGEKLQPDHAVIGRYFVWLAIPFSVIVSWVFHTIQKIGLVAENPFEGSANDVPISTMSRGIEIDLRELNDELPEAIPGPIPAEHGVQM